MKKTHQSSCNFSKRHSLICWAVGVLFLFLQSTAFAQTFEFPSSVFADTISLREVLTTTFVDCDSFDVNHDGYYMMSDPKRGGNFTIKSVVALTKLMVDVQSSEVGKYPEFTYMITYRTMGWTDTNSAPIVSSLDTLTISYDGDSLQLINDRTFKIAGEFSMMRVFVCDVFEITNSGGVLSYQPITPGPNPNVPDFVYIVGEVHVQKFWDYSSLNMGTISMTNNISSNGTVLLDWGSGFGLTYDITPAAYEVEWTYVSPYGPQDYDFRNNATRIFTNNTSYSIPVAEKEGTLVYRVRMVRPDLDDLLLRKYGAWSITAEQGSVSSVSGDTAQIQSSTHDDMNWDMKMSFVEDGKYKQVMTYYDGLLKNRQVQTRFNSNPTQTIIAQSLYDYEGRAVINSLPIPVSGISKFSYLDSFLRPLNAAEYPKSAYDAFTIPTCPFIEPIIPALDPNAMANQYFSANNSNKTGKNAFIPDAEGYPMVRKILSPENNDKVLFEGQAGLALQIGLNNRHMKYLYGLPIQAELNRYFGQDIGKYNYYRKMITTDNHNQDMFSITDGEGKIVASGLIGSPDTSTFALSIRNLPDTGFFHSNLLPVPNIRMDEHWRNNGSYFVETKANYEFEYSINYNPYQPCPDTNVGLSPKVYYDYEVIDPCGVTRLRYNGDLGTPGVVNPNTNISLFEDTSVSLEKGTHTWKKYSYIKMDDVRASVDSYLAGGYYKCFNTLDHFIKLEFENDSFPCPGNYDPCGSLRLSMMKELYPGAKYGKYQYTDSSKRYAGPGNNSVFSVVSGNTLKYQDTCIEDYVDCGDTIYNLKEMPPDTLIYLFNDSIAAALLPLHPEYCKLLLCPILSNPYVKRLGSIKKASEAMEIGRFELSDIAAYDPFVPAPVNMSTDALMRTMVDSLSIDSMAFIKTICGSESGVIESVCANINATKTPGDITSYPEHLRDEYYKNLIELYTANRDNRISKYIENIGSSCGPCSLIRLDDNSDTLEYGPENDTTFLVGGMDSMGTNLNLPVNGSFSRYYDPGSGFDADSLNAYKNADNSKYCTELIEHITNSLASCNVSQTKLQELQDTLENRFCKNNSSITALSYDSLTSIMTDINITANDLCNAGLVDLRRITRKSHDFIQLGLLQRPAAYYDDLRIFLSGKGILNSFTGIDDTMTVSLELCDSHPFQQRLAEILGTSPSSNCADTQNVTLVRTVLREPNAIQLAFIDNSIEVDYFLYPTDSREKNALHDSFYAPIITGTNNYEINSLFNLYGFDKVSQSCANRNTTILHFDGTQNSVQKSFSYFLSAFTEQADYNMMEADTMDFLNGIGCSEFIPMASEAVSMAEQLNIKYGHPYFERFFTNVVNYRNGVNFDFNNYNGALVSCGVTDSIIIPKHIAHFRIQFPTMNDLEAYVDTLRDYDTLVSVSDVKSYDLNGNNYLIFNVHEAHGSNINDAKQIVEALAPGGSVVEYMPYQQKDTLAQLFVYDMDVPNQNQDQFKDLLINAFPDATITPGSTDPVTHVNLDYFIPGRNKISLSGAYFTIVKSINTADTYNHYVDSIYKFLAANAPMTTIFTHAEPGVSAQYDDLQMKNWREYVHSLPANDHYVNVKGSKPQSIKANKPYFSGSTLSYKNSKSPYYLNNLYIDDNASNTTYDYIVNLLNDLQSANNTILKTYAHNQPLVVTTTLGDKYTRAYVCGDTTQFWINHFDHAKKMTNIFIKLPDYLPMSRDKYALDSVTKGVERDSVDYINVYMTGTDGPLTHSIHCIGYTNRKLGEIYTIPSAYLSSHSKFESLSGKFENCETRKIRELYPIAQIKYNLYRDSMRNVLVDTFRQHIITYLQEQLTIKGKDIKHGLTLYYYDVAGNLMMTVPPAGVDEINVSSMTTNSNIDNARASLYSSTSSGSGQLTVPTHVKTTKYSYNAQNQVRTTNTPDTKGITENFYDLSGRIVMSQNAQQRSDGKCTYFLYDNLSRVIETGVVSTANTDWNRKYFRDSLNMFNSMVKAKGRLEVTATIYDTASYQVAGAFVTLPPQENLKNRIACVKYFDYLNGGVSASKDTNYFNALHYSYDVSGNIKTLIHDLRNTADKLLRFKRVDYEYDLYSGKVILVSYNRGYADQFYQKYSYDSDNRITEAYTSNNGIYWDRDAHYEYYEHGPLARVEIGEQRVQGVDYAYTINGWLKAINGVQNDTANDMGIDGKAGLATPKDVFSQRVDYFAGDYKSIGDPDFIWQLPATQKALYNGNIAASAVALAPFDNMYKLYHYDPLQRIDRAQYEEYTINNGGSPSYTKTPTTAWATEYKYDPDGNLLRLRRMGGDVPGTVPVPTHLMDTLEYEYETGTNQLRYLSDFASTAQYKIDIQHPDDTLTDYTYDGNGNMRDDFVSDIRDIQWNHAGKVKHLYRSDNNTRMYFNYDPLGNRLNKEVVFYPAQDSMVKLKTTYIRDAAGNILAIYEDKKEFDVSKITFDKVKGDPWIGTGGGPISAPLGKALADVFYAAYASDPGSNPMAKLAMAIPDLSDYTDNSSLLQSFVSNLDPADALDFVKSIPAITSYTLLPPGSTVADTKLSQYLQTVLMSEDLETLQTDLFVALKTNDNALYNSTVSTVPSTQQEKDDFPVDPTMLQDFRAMEPGDKLSITNTLAQALTTVHITTLPYVVDVLLDAFSTSNTYANFVQELSNGSTILDQVQQDAVSYIAYRYALADMEEVPFATVKAEFSSNPVLTDIISQGGPEPDAEALASILTTNFADAVAVADANGQGTNFADALKGLILVNAGPIDVAYKPDWLRTTYALQSQRQYLAEHHIYGSSRLGIQKYLPDEAQYHYKSLGVGGTTNTLSTTRPWYSLYGNDLFKPTVYSNTLDTATSSTAGLGINSHVLGKRQYELTNHLGNVQSTVLDRATPVIKQQDTSVIGYHSDISLAHDYYPFGMLMPGRYVSDTAQKCVTINTSILVPVIVKVYLDGILVTGYRNGDPNTVPVHNLPVAMLAAGEHPYVYHYNDAGTHPNGEVVTGELVNDRAEYGISLSEEPSGGVTAYFVIHPDTSQTDQELGFDLTLPEDCYMRMRVRQYTGTGEEYDEAVSWTSVDMSGAQQLLVPMDKAAVAAGGKTILELEFNSAMGGDFPANQNEPDVFIRNYYTKITHYVPHTRIAYVCDEKDNYRFGFNGMEKDNEAKGIGNSLDFGARIYDSRLGRFLSVDPKIKQYPWQTSYCLADNNPILFEDIEGEGTGVPATLNMILVDPTSALKLLDARQLAIATRGSLDAAANANSIGLYDIFGGDHTDEYSSVDDQIAYNMGRLAGDLASIATGAAEIEGGGTTAVAGLSSGPGALVISTGGGAVALHGSGVVYTAATDAGETTNKLKNLYAKKAEETNRHGGGKNAQHTNQKAKQSAQEKYDVAKKEYDQLKSKPNKTKADKDQLKKLENQKNHLQKQAQKTGENHSQKAKGSNGQSR